MGESICPGAHEACFPYRPEEPLKNPERKSTPSVFDYLLAVQTLLSDKLLAAF